MLGMHHKATVAHMIMNRLFSRIDGASLGVYRICLGLAVAYSLLQFVPPGAVKFDSLFVVPEWNFPYPGFEWVQRMPSMWMKMVFGAGGIAALLFAAGWFTRSAAVIMFFSYAYYFLVEAARFNNHFYLITLLAFLAIWMPCDRRFALRILPESVVSSRKSLWNRVLNASGMVRKSNSPTDIARWPVFMIRAQLLIVYIYGAIAKINADWFTGEPMLGAAEVFLHKVGAVLPFLHNYEPIVYAIAMAWIGFWFDLLIGFILLIPRTRLLGIALLLCFHGINHIMLPIGVFPFLALTASLIFLDPDWPLRFGRWLKRPRWIKPDWNWAIPGAILLPGLGILLGWKLGTRPVGKKRLVMPRRASLVTALVMVWIFLQMVIPLRHFTIAGDPSWTEEGQFFAWRMMLRQKSAGSLTLHLHDEQNYLEGSGGRRVDWSKLPGIEGKAIYIPIDVLRFTWDGNEGLNTIYEGYLGYRMFEVVKGASESEIDAEKQELQQWWKEKTGQTLQIRKTRPIDECVSNVQNLLAQISRDSGADSVEKELALFNDIEEQLRILNSMTRSQRARFIAGMHDQLNTLRGSRYESEIFREMELAHPFSILGVDPPENIQFWLLAQRDDASQLQSLAKQLDRDENYLVWCDFARLRFYEWEGLPKWFPVFESGRLPFLCNFYKEMNFRQITQMSVRPYMMRQFARRNAKQWEEKYGRRPEIHGYGMVMMNYRYPVPIIDSEVDLASVEYSFFKHNQWILPHESERFGITEYLSK